MSRRVSNSVRAARRVLCLVSTAALFAAASFAQMGVAAKVIVMSGRVVVSRGTPFVLAEGDFIKPSETITTGPDGSAVFQVSDGSEFTVYPNSQVVFRANPGSLKDLVDIYLGKIKVKIEHFGNVPNHNTVRTPTAVIAVRGTVFDVDVNGIDETTQVLCEEGRVEVSHLLMPGGGSRMLNPGESVTIFKNQPLAKATIDHGVLAQKVFRALSDTLDQILLHRAAGGTTTASTGTTTASTSGDKGGGTPTPTGGAPPPPPHN